MKTIDYDSITDILLNISDPNTWAVVSQVPGVSSPKINAGTSVYNIEAEWWIAWWSTDVTWSSTDYNTVAWSSGNIYLPDWTSLPVSSWNTSNMSSITYIYYEKANNTVQTTHTASLSVWESKILLCVANPTTSWKDAEFQAFGTNAQSTFITADNIAANSITGNEIQANSITSGKIDVSYLSAISADLWSITAWDITWTTITAWATNATAVRLDPDDSRIKFYYSGSNVWNIFWRNVSGVGWAIGIDGDYLYSSADIICWGKLRVPVWTNLYD